MTERFYVSTSESGTELSGSEEIYWQLPDPARPGEPADPTEGPRLVLRRPSGLLDVLDERIFTAEALTAPEEESGDELVVTSARLLKSTPWDPASAARFTLDCSAHVLGEAGEVELPGGFSLASAIADAREFLSEATEETGERLGRLARFATARRLRKTGARIGDIGLAILEDDIAQELDATADPTWTTTTAAGDAVLAAVEALRHLAAPRYVAAREENAEREGVTEAIVIPALVPTPWGPITVGAESESPYLPAAVLAREAAFRAREAAGEDGAEAERSYQAALLAEVLEAS